MPRVRVRSRLRFSRFRYIDGVMFWDLVEIPTIPVQADDISHTVIANDRHDDLAHLYYADPSLWSIIAAANDIDLMPTGLVIGDVLRIPSPRYVLEVLFPQRQRF